MSDPLILRPASQLAGRGRQFRAVSDESPTRQRIHDDLLSRLSPRSAVQVLQDPSGPLKDCLDAATSAEQSFALRAAMASQRIFEWLEELSEWPWPHASGSAGFEMPGAKRRKVSHDDTGSEWILQAEEAAGETAYVGSLLASEVARYELRVEDISRGLDALDLEEIKKHVLHNHIMPLSRPGSPISDAGRSVTSSLASFVRMDDLAAVVTATVVQTLPNLSKLRRLMDTWSIRLVVLRRTTSLLDLLAEAEVALQSGWNAMHVEVAKDTVHPELFADGSTRKGSSNLTRKDFDVMKPIVERKVAKAGRELDFMLDHLDGREDTLPEEWLDRMEAVEKDYSEWIAACEGRIREAEWLRMVQENKNARALSPEPETPSRVAEDASLAVTTRKDKSSYVDVVSQDALPTPQIMVHPAEERRKGLDPQESDAVEKSTATIDGTSEDEVGVRPQTASEKNSRDSAVDLGRENSLLEKDLRAISNFDGSTPLETDGQVDVSADDLLPLHSQENGESPLPSVESDDISKEAANGHEAFSQEDDDILEFEPPLRLGSEFSEPDLPPLPRPSTRDSEASNASTIVHGSQPPAMEFSSDLPVYGTPDHHRVRNVAPEESLDDDFSSPPAPFRSSTRSVSVSFNDMPTVAEIPNDDSRPETPLEPLDVEDDRVSKRGLDSPSKMSVTSADDQLQQQISEILESIPAKISLRSEPAINHLNPPDFQMPRAARSKPDLIPRSHSSMSTQSSRAGTPSFLLAPAYNRKSRAARHSGGNQEIKLYHLSRSNGEAPIKLFIRCVGENGERVMVRVGGGWADLGEYLKEYASHHSRRSGGEGKVEVRDLPRVSTATGHRGSSPTPQSRPASAMDSHSTGVASSPITPLTVRKTRRSMGGGPGEDRLPKTPLATASTAKSDTPSSGASTRSRSSSRLSWSEEDSSLGMAGPRARNVEMSDESRAWVESVKEKVRMASGERRASDQHLLLQQQPQPQPIPQQPPQQARTQTPTDGQFGEMGKVGATKRLFRRQV